MNLLVFLGHGRALELYLGCLKITIGGSLIITELGYNSPILADLAWYYSDATLAAPFFVAGGLQLIGWTLNIYGVEHNWIWRTIGAMLGILLWSTLLIKSGLIRDTTLATPLAIACLPSSLFLLWRAWNRFPVPGVTGAR
jgi:hypothetical protein